MLTNEKNKINNTALLNKVESEYLKENVPNVRVGDTVRLGVEIREGKKTRVQAFEGVVLKAAEMPTHKKKELVMTIRALVSQFTKKERERERKRKR